MFIYPIVSTPIRQENGIGARFHLRNFNGGKVIDESEDYTLPHSISQNHKHQSTKTQLKPHLCKNIFQDTLNVTSDVV